MEIVIITLNNAPVHTSIQTRKLMSILNFNACFLLQYSPN